MTDRKTMVTWVDARERFPEVGVPVAVAVTGRYPAEGGGDTASGEEFWLVRTVYFTDRYQSEDGGTHHDCFVDSDGVVSFPYAPDRNNSVTHWAELPTLPGTETHFLDGEDVGQALRSAWDTPTGA
ncbi:AQJ64_40280 family protein [Streptomyces sp. NPDC058373]|uniref:AQJ64_40280 family protein n=1 Tax=unclassified Streptomyces TaxID=2593676 RepID=UPI003646B3F3